MTASIGPDPDRSPLAHRSRPSRPMGRHAARPRHPLTRVRGALEKTRGLSNLMSSTSTGGRVPPLRFFVSLQQRYSLSLRNLQSKKKENTPSLSGDPKLSSSLSELVMIFPHNAHFRIPASLQTHSSFFGIHSHRTKRVSRAVAPACRLRHSGPQHAGVRGASTPAFKAGSGAINSWSAFRRPLWRPSLCRRAESTRLVGRPERAPAALTEERENVNAAATRNKRYPGLPEQPLFASPYYPGSARSLSPLASLPVHL